jgi:Tfp pilus assembly protein FimV
MIRQLQKSARIEKLQVQCNALSESLKTTEAKLANTERALSAAEERLKTPGAVCGCAKE